MDVQDGHSDGDGVTLVPDRARAAGWTAVGLVATSLAAYAVGSSRWLPFTAALAVLCAVPTAVFLLQLFAPEAWTLHVDRQGLRGTVATFPVEQSFAAVRAVELDTVAGEPVVVMLGPGGDRRRLLLPVGCDLEALRSVLREVEHDKARRL